VSALLDVNVLLALFDPVHEHHAEAFRWWTDNRADGWASCPLTQNGFVRVISNPGYARPLPLAEAVSLIGAQAARPDHVFWPDDISLLDATLFDHRQLRGPRQITDAYLLALARKNGGRLVTFDQSFARDAVRGVQDVHLVTL
jgi:uncharacterized protein